MRPPRRRGVARLGPLSEKKSEPLVKLTPGRASTVYRVRSGKVYRVRYCIFIVRTRVSAGLSIFQQAFSGNRVGHHVFPAYLDIHGAPDTIDKIRTGNCLDRFGMPIKFIAILKALHHSASGAADEVKSRIS